MQEDSIQPPQHNVLLNHEHDRNQNSSELAQPPTIRKNQQNTPSVRENVKAAQIHHAKGVGQITQSVENPMDSIPSMEQLQEKAPSQK